MKRVRDPFSGGDRGGKGRGLKLLIGGRQKGGKISMFRREKKSDKGKRAKSQLLAI